jgi:iron complex outermembrane receptor protein
MKHFQNSLVMVLLMISMFTQAQIKTGSIRGTVRDASGTSIIAASVSLLNAKDSSLVKISVSDISGNYSFDNLQPEKYIIAATSVGFGKSYSGAIELPGTNSLVQVNPIILKAQSKDLKEVTVVSRKPLIEQKIDRTIINVEAAVTNTGSSALEVLEKSPGVQVDKDGNISLKGKQGVIILLDGRPSYLSGTELANMLKGMQASQLEQIEIMTNPPAKFDASGNAGVINIKTKKNKAKGFNGSITAGAGQGVYFKTNESISLNYRTGKINLFSNYSFGKSENFQELKIFRRYSNTDKSTRAIFEQTAFWRSSRMNNNLKIGMDYSFDKKTIIGVVVSGFYNPENERGHNISYLKDPASKIDSIVQATSFSKEVWKNGSVNLNMRHQYDSTGRELTADIDFIKYNSTNDQHFVNTTFTPAWSKKYDEQLRGDLPIDINIYSGKIDYTHPFKKGAKLELGWKSSYVVTDSRAKYFEPLNGNWEVDYKRTNYFEYKENINAAYVNFNKQLTKKLGVQTGLRLENTNYKGYQYGNNQKPDSSFNNTYNGLFPTVYFSYAANKNNQFGVSFGRRIDRPAYQDLNPFLFFIDKYTYGQGNPYLKPQYSNNIEVSHIFKGVLTTTINYSSTKNMFMETFDQEGEYATIVRRGNIGRREHAGIAINAQIPVGKWLTSIIYTNYNYNKFTGSLNGEVLNAEAGSLTFNINNQFRFNTVWSAEISGWYRTKGIEGQIAIQPMGQLAAGISRQVLKGKGSVKLNVRDLFYTQIVKGQMNFKSTEVSFINRRDSRVANLSFTYRFGKPLNGNGQRKKGSAGDEQNRVKTGD